MKVRSEGNNTMATIIFQFKNEVNGTQKFLTKTEI